jgi:hypothetical protein
MPTPEEYDELYRETFLELKRDREKAGSSSGGQKRDVLKTRC